jgi:tetratricopeptide (TPR) repeat protein
MQARSGENDMETSQPSKRQKFLPFLTGLLLALLACGIPLLLFVSSGRFRDVITPFAYAAQTAAAPSGTQPVGVDPGAGPTATSDISSLPYSKRYELADDDISEALNHMWNGETAEEIMSWDKVLEIIPEDAEAHYNRGNAYLKLSRTQRSQEEFLFYLSKAGEDFDKAIELEPYHKGDYYYSRFLYLDGLSSSQSMNRNDFLNLEQAALDNLLMANQLGNYQKDSEIKLALVYIAAGKCDEGIEQANRLIAETTDPTVDMIGSLSRGYFCKNDLPNALKYMSEVVNRVDGCSSRFDRARIYYAMGGLENALTDLNATIQKSPNYCGIRYYLRGLIYAEQGELDKAQEDFVIGMGNTWERGGLLAYGQAKLALAQDDQETAIQYLQEAESTYTFPDPIYNKILEDLNSLGAKPLTITASIAPATAIPSPTPRLTPRPTSSPDPSLPTPAFTEDPSLQYATIIDLEKPIEPVEIGWGFSVLWHFQPAQSLDHREVQRLSVWLISSDTTQKLPHQISLWNFRNNMWGGNNNLYWGENKIDRANEYVSPEGDVYIKFASDNDSIETTIDTFGITLVLQRTNGSIEVHGITP